MLLESRDNEAENEHLKVIKDCIGYPSKWTDERMHKFRLQMYGKSLFLQHSHIYISQITTCGPPSLYPLHTLCVCSCADLHAYIQVCPSLHIYPDPSGNAYLISSLFIDIFYRSQNLACMGGRYRGGRPPFPRLVKKIRGLFFYFLQNADSNNFYL